MKKLLGIIVLSLLWCNVGFGEIITLKCKKNAEHNIVVLGGKEHLFKNERSYDVETAQYVSSIQYNVNLMNLKILENNRAEILVKGKKVAELLWEGSDVKEIVNGKVINSCIAIKSFTTGQPQTLTSEDTASVSSSTQDQQYASTPKFVNIIKDKFYHKQFKRFMKTPEAELCISYINAYGWHKREKKQAIKYEVLETRNINCDRYMEAAYYDKKERDGEMQDAVKKVFDSGVDAAYGVDTNASKKSKQRCIVQKVGKNMYTQTCR